MMQKMSWVPLQDKQGGKCILWNYDKDDPRWVVYRFVWTAADTPEVVFYVGSGLNLSGGLGDKTSLKHQYLHGERKRRYRLPMEQERAMKGGTFWTEVLDVQDSELKCTIDTECAQKIKTQLENWENYFIYLSFLDYLSAYRTHGPTIF